MSIFQQSFATFVQDQIKVREDILAEGIDVKTGKSTPENRSSNFFDYTLNKQCTMRLSSGVNIIDENIVKADDIFGMKSGLNEGLAQKWVLEGGVKLSGNEKILLGDDTSQGGYTSKVSQDTIDKGLRGGISNKVMITAEPPPSSNYNNYGGMGNDEFSDDGYTEEWSEVGYEGAYGSTSLRSDAGEGYGIVPMPGITSVNIRTKSAYGSLREAKVKFVCHNKRQLEVLELLYMRPGYTLMLEWQWTPYINNDGEKSNMIHYVENFFDENITSTYLERHIMERKEFSGGNYDAVIGYCKNFTYTLRNDGGFDCSTEIIAKGEVIESLKTTTIGNVKDSGGKPKIEILLKQIFNIGGQREINSYEVYDQEYFLERVSGDFTYDDVIDEMEDLEEQSWEGGQTVVGSRRNEYRMKVQKTSGKYAIAYSHQNTIAFANTAQHREGNVDSETFQEKLSHGSFGATTKDYLLYRGVLEEDIESFTVQHVRPKTIKVGENGEVNPEAQDSWGVELDSMDHKLLSISMGDKLGAKSGEQLKWEDYLGENFPSLDDFTQNPNNENLNLEGLEQTLRSQVQTSLGNYGDTAYTHNPKLDNTILSPWILRHSNPDDFYMVKNSYIVDENSYNSGDNNSDADSSGLRNTTLMESDSTYVRWDVFCHLLNEYIIPKNEKNEPLFILQAYHIINEFEGLGKCQAKPLRYQNILMNRIEERIPKVTRKDNSSGIVKWDGDKLLDWNAADISTNAQICLLPHNLRKILEDEHKASFLKNDKDKFYGVFPPLMANLLKHSPRNLDAAASIPFLKAEDFDHSIGGIYLGVEFLYYKFKELYYTEEGDINEDFNLFTYIKEIWNTVNETTTNHKFDLHIDNRTGGYVVRVIDMQVDNKELAENKEELNIHTLNIQSPNSICRKISYHTTIPSALSSTIAIAAQAPNDVDSLEQVSFAALNKGIVDRFATNRKSYDVEPSISFDQKAAWNERFESNLVKLYHAIFKQTENYFTQELTGNTNQSRKKNENPSSARYGGVLRRMIYQYYQEAPRNYFIEVEDAEGEMNEEPIKVAKKAMLNVRKAIAYFINVYGSDDESGEERYYRGQPDLSQSPSVSAIIPLKFNVQMDGISGIIIGSIFKLPKDKLPKGYQGDDIFFIVMGEEQQITAGQDWTTKITGQIIMLNKDPIETESADFKESWDNANLDVDANILNAIENGLGLPSADEEIPEAYTPLNTPQGKEMYGFNFGPPFEKSWKAKVNSKFGRRDLNKDGVWSAHEGVDLDTNSGTKLYAMCDGTVIHREFDKWCGGKFTIKRKDIPEAKKDEIPIRITYCHMKEFAPNIAVGDSVKKGQYVGLSGGRINKKQGGPDKGHGRSSGAHLHITMRIHSRYTINDLRAMFGDKINKVPEAYKENMLGKRRAVDPLLWIPTRLQSDGRDAIIIEETRKNLTLEVTHTNYQRPTAGDSRLGVTYSKTATVLTSQLTDAEILAGVVLESTDSRLQYSEETVISSGFDPDVHAIIDQTGGLGFTPNINGQNASLYMLANEFEQNNFDNNTFGNQDFQTYDFQNYLNQQEAANEID